MVFFRVSFISIFILMPVMALAGERIAVFRGASDFSAAKSELDTVNDALIQALQSGGFSAIPVTFSDPRTLELFDYLLDPNVAQSDKANVRTEFVMQVKAQTEYSRALFTSVVNRHARYARGDILWDGVRKKLEQSGSIKTEFGGDLTKHLNHQSMAGRDLGDGEYNALSLKIDIYSATGEFDETRYVGISVPYVFDSNKKKFLEKEYLFVESSDLNFLNRTIKDFVNEL